MRLLRRLAVLATVADAVRRFAKNNPEQFSKYVERAAGFINQRTDGKYSKQVNGATQKLKDVTGASSAGSSSASNASSNASSPATSPAGSTGRPRS